MAEKIIMYTTDWCGDCRRAKRFLDERQIAYENVNIEQVREGLEIVRKLNNGNRSVPTIVFPDGSILVEPSNVQLAQKLGLPFGEN
ncbi:MAG: NrdH-redoxin [Chloroflexi bacterium]|nr:NrdH-redoxin [Chloroflexota bacterium]